MPNFRTYSVFLVSNFLSLSTGKWEFCLCFCKTVCLYLFCFRLVPMVWCKALGDSSFFFFAGTIDFLFFLLVYAWCFVNCQSNLQIFCQNREWKYLFDSPQDVEILPQKMCACIFFIQHTLSPKNLIFFFCKILFLHVYLMFFRLFNLSLKTSHSSEY